jgi:GTP cyclohydrolase I
MLSVEQLTEYLLNKENTPHDFPQGHDVLENTPGRFAKAWEFWTSGYHSNPAEVLKTFECSDVDCLVFQANIPIWSLCQHHLSPFWGRVHIGYIPNGRVVGLSKLARLVDVFARRLQLQERLGQQICTALMEHLVCKGAGVVIQARHSCMESRGVEKAGTHTITSSLSGCLYEDKSARAEFMSLVNVAVQGPQGV